MSPHLHCNDSTVHAPALDDRVLFGCCWFREAVINVLSEWYVEAANHCSGEWTVRHGANHCRY